MSLFALIKKGGLTKAMTATPATIATQDVVQEVTVAPVATVTVAAKPETPLLDLSPDEEAQIRAWLTTIEERDPEIIAETLETCRTDGDARAYFINQAAKVPKHQLLDDDRRYCTTCKNLAPSGLCLAAYRDEINATSRFYPPTHLPRRCTSYVAGTASPNTKTAFNNQQEKKQ